MEVIFLLCRPRPASLGYCDERSSRKQLRRWYIRIVNVPEALEPVDCIRLREWPSRSVQGSMTSPYQRAVFGANMKLRPER